MKVLIRCTAGVVGFVLMIGVVLMSSGVKAEDSATNDVAVTVSSSCQMDATVNTAHEAEVSTGIYRENIGKTTIAAICNDANGYAIYAIGYTNTEFGRNDMLGATTGRTIPTGTATSGQTSNWAMKLAAVSGTVAPTIVTGYDSYHAVPSGYTKVASYANSTTENPNGSQFETTYAVFVTSSQVADTYNGKVKYTLVHPSDTTDTPCVSKYTINYNSNGGSGNMDSQEACVDRATTLLSDGFTPPAPVAENQFVIWNTAADGSGYNYHAGQSVTNLASAGDSITLYAQWAPKYIQDLTSSMCNVVASENPFTVYDRRDGNGYTVRYIAGTCWMTQNLRITGTVNSQYSNFSTYNNVDVCINDLAEGNTNNEPRCHDSGNITNGVWYNYAATSAKTVVGEYNNINLTEDICPAGWRLPSSSSFGTITSYKNAFSPVVGYYYNGAVDNSSGVWWSSSRVNYFLAYRLVYGSSSGNLSVDGNGSNTTNSYGYSIRCVR